MHAADRISPALERVVGRFEGLVRQAGRKHDLAETDLDEVFQEVRIRLWRALGSADRIESAPASYVYRTAMSAAVDLIRRRRRAPQSVELSHEASRAPESSAPAASMERQELAAELEEALASLGDTRRPVVRMYLSGYGREEIADLLGWSEAKTRNLLYRGLADLREELRRRGVVPGGREGAVSPRLREVE